MDGWVCIGVDKYAKSEYRKGTVILTSSNAFIIILRLKISLTNYSENKSDVICVLSWGERKSLSRHKIFHTISKVNRD